MFLITSAAYISPGLASEFGKLPPSMLPVQSRRLYERQIALAPSDDMIVLSLPHSYVLTKYDKKRLLSFGVRIVAVPEGLSLGQSVVYVLNVVANYNQPLSILHGDTLFSEISTSSDMCSVANAEDAYDWASANQHDELIYSGYFSFSNQSLLISKITEANYNFIAGVEDYSKEIPLSHIELPNWMDFSLVNSYYRSTSKLTTQRVFNTIIVTRYGVTKSSKDRKKMAAEAHWIKSLPKSMKHYAPTVWDVGENDEGGFYEIEYYYLSSLANLFVFGCNKLYVWEEIIDACSTYLDEEIIYKPNELETFARQNDKLYTIKTIERLQKYVEQSGISLSNEWVINNIKVPSLEQIVTETGEMITKNEERFVTLMHGDPCFSNILYDFKSKSIKLVDPRGIDNDGNITIYGDFRYDVAKLAHSVLGMYDFIIGGMYDYKETSPYQIEMRFEESEVISKVQAYFRSKRFGGYSLQELSTYPILVHLFLSMLPLHCDYPDRQKAMLVNALRLYIEMKNSNDDRRT